MEAQIAFIFLNHTMSSCTGCLLRPQRGNTLSCAGVLLPSSEALDGYPSLHMGKTSPGNMEKLPPVETAGSEQGMLSPKPKRSIFLWSCVRMEPHTCLLPAGHGHGQPACWAAHCWKTGPMLMRVQWHRLAQGRRHGVFVELSDVG